jgi:peptidoglycan hydrolase FlgJ
MKVTLDAGNTGSAAMDVAKRSKLEDAAQQFEAMMLQELLKPMRTSADDLGGEKSEDGSFDTIASFGTESVAKSIAASGGLGIAKQVVRQLSARAEADGAAHKAPGISTKV